MRATMTISLPPGLYKRVRGFPDENWSAVCREVIRNKIDELELGLPKFEEPPEDKLRECTRRILEAAREMSGIVESEEIRFG